MEQNPLCIAFASQKGGVGKSTLTVLAASWLHYLHGIRVAVVDCDYPQHSILKLSNRDKAVVQSSAIYGRLLVSLAENKGVKPYRILCCKPSEAMSEWRKWAAVAEERYDVVLFDLPGTLRSEGVIYTISQMDYVFVPLKADNIVMQSSLQFAEALDEELVQKHNCNLKGIHLFWNMLDRRERTDIYQRWNAVIREDNLRLMATALPASARFNKELSAERNSIFRSTLFPPDTRQLRGSGVQELAGEICSIIDLK